MARTFSNMLPLATTAPSFCFEDTNSNHPFALPQNKGEKGTVVMFLCNHCPYVIHVIEELVRIANDYTVQGIQFVAISSNDIVKYPQDSPELMTAFAFQHKIPFPYLYDPTQEIAQAHDAACTPDFYFFDHDLKLIYRGQMDDSRPGNTISVSGTDLRNAIDSQLYNRHLNPIQKPSMGCGIKWK